MSSGKRFGAILRNSRLTQVSSAPAARSNNPIYDIQKPYTPQRQVIGTTPASRVRRDFGLKNAMPKGWNSPYITLESIDHNGMTKYDHGSSFHFKKQRFAEMGTALVSANPNVPSLFAKPAENKQWNDLKLCEIKTIVRNAPSRRQEFLKYFRETEKRSTFKADEAHGELVTKFYGITNNNNRLAQKSVIKGNAGMSYLLKGSMRNSNYNKGTIYGRLVQGRVNPNVGYGSSVNTASVGGFVAQFPGANNNTSKMAIDNSRLDDNGQINLTARVFEDKKPNSPSVTNAVHRVIKSSPVHQHSLDGQRRNQQ